MNQLIAEFMKPITAAYLAEVQDRLALSALDGEESAFSASEAYMLLCAREVTLKLRLGLPLDASDTDRIFKHFTPDTIERLGIDFSDTRTRPEDAVEKAHVRYFYLTRRVLDATVKTRYAAKLRDFADFCESVNASKPNKAVRKS